MSLKDKVKKILPYAAVGVVGVALIVVIVVAMKKRSKTAGSVLAPLADPAYGTATASDIPWYDQYQDGRSPTSDVKSLQANPTSLNLTYTGAIPPAPVNIVANVRCFAAKGVITGNVLTHFKVPNGMEHVCANQGCMDQSAVNYDPKATCPGVNLCVPKL